MKLLKYILGGIAALIVIIVLGGVIAVNVSPKPFIFFLNHMSGLNEVTPRPSDIESYTAQVDIVKDVTYTSTYGSNKLDIFLPKEDKNKKYPTIVWTHGGSFIGGDKSGTSDWATMMASKGYVVVSINYEVAPASRYPGPVKQLDEAYRYLERLQDSYYQMDLSKVVIGGDSAGAQIASQFVAVQTNPKLAKEMNMKPSIPQKSLKATVLYCGPYDIQGMLDTDNKLITFFVNQIGWAYLGMKDWATSEEINQASTSRQVTENYPPTFLSDGNSGSFEKQAKNLQYRLETKNVPVETLFFPSTKLVPHEYQFELDTTEAKECFEKTLSFLKTYTG